MSIHTMQYVRRPSLRCKLLYNEVQYDGDQSALIYCNALKILDKGPYQGYRNRYDIIDHGHKNTFMYFFKDL